MLSALVKQGPVLKEVDVQVEHLLVVDLWRCAGSDDFGKDFHTFTLLVDFLKDKEVGLHDSGNFTRIFTLSCCEDVPEVFNRDAFELMKQILHLLGVLLSRFDG